jgi:hypothetical protein
MESPLERFLGGELQAFGDHLRQTDRADTTVDKRIRGAEQFVLFLLGRATEKYERGRGTIGQGAGSDG